MSEESHEQDSIEIIHDAICPVCGKNYIPAPFHLYKIYGHARVCSWTCQLKGERENIRIQHGAPRTKQILMYDKNGIFIRKYSSAAEASKDLNISVACIGRCCRKQSAYAGNYVFRYQKDGEEK